MTPKKHYGFMIDPELDAALKTVKERDGISEGEQIRRALREWMKRKGVTVKAPRQRASTRRLG